MWTCQEGCREEKEEENYDDYSCLGPASPQAPAQGQRAVKGGKGQFTAGAPRAPISRMEWPSQRSFLGTRASPEPGVLRPPASHPSRPESAAEGARQ